MKEVNNKIVYYSIVLLCILNTIQIGEYAGERYFLPLLGCFISWFLFTFYSLNSRNNLKLTDVNVHFIPFTLLIVCIYIGSSNTEEAVFDFIKISLAFSMSYLLSTQLTFLSNEQIKKVVLLMTSSAIIVLSLELLGRILYSENSIVSVLTSNFYLLKVNSPFFQDTNATGLYALSIFCILVYYNNVYSPIKHKTISVLIFVIFLFLITSLSRAAIISAMLLLMIDAFIKLRNISKVMIVMLAMFLFVLSIHMFFELVSSDGSGKTKLLIVQSVIDKYDIISGIDFLFGFGINAGNYAYSFHEGEYSHLLLTMLLGQVGIIGLFIYMSFFIMKAIISRGATLYVFIPFFVVGLSYLHPFLESVFFASGFVFGLSQSQGDRIGG